MNYKQELQAAMERLAEDPRTIFVGYGVRIGGAALGTLNRISVEQRLEMPVAENLMMGAAMGLALAGRIPVVFIERMDFLLNAADALVNHLDKIETMSRGEFAPKVIVRAVVGNRTKPLFTGETHTQDFADAFKRMLKMPVYRLEHAGQVAPIYGQVMMHKRSAMVVEYKDLH